MNKKLQKIKIIIVFFLIFYSLLYILCPTGKSASLDPIYECEPEFIIQYNESLLEKPVIPYDEPLIVPITIKARIYGKVTDIVLENLRGIDLVVYLSIAEVSEGCHASINPPILRFKISDKFESTKSLYE